MADEEQRTQKPAIEHPYNWGNFPRDIALANGTHPPGDHVTIYGTGSTDFKVVVENHSTGTQSLLDDDGVRKLAKIIKPGLEKNHPGNKRNRTSKDVADTLTSQKDGVVGYINDAEFLDWEL